MLKNLEVIEYCHHNGYIHPLVNQTFAMEDGPYTDDLPKSKLVIFIAMFVYQKHMYKGDEMGI